MLLKLLGKQHFMLIKFPLWRLWLASKMRELFKELNIDPRLFHLLLFLFFLESLKKLESDYRNNLRKLQGDDREVGVY